MLYSFGPNDLTNWDADENAQDWHGYRDDEQYDDEDSYDYDVDDYRD